MSTRYFIDGDVLDSMLDGLTYIQQSAVSAIATHLMRGMKISWSGSGWIEKDVDGLDEDTSVGLIAGFADPEDWEGIERYVIARFSVEAGQLLLPQGFLIDDNTGEALTR